LKGFRGFGGMEMIARMAMVRFGFEGEVDSIFCGQIEREDLSVSLDIFFFWKQIILLT
jgi:hypothetical protein